MAYEAYVKFEGTTGGHSSGSSVRHNWKDGTLVHALDYPVMAPRDVSTGQASGKRQWKPVVITTEWGASSPSLFQAALAGESMSAVPIHFVNVGNNGSEPSHTIELVNAKVVSIELLPPKKHGGKHGGKITLACQAILHNGVEVPTFPIHLVTQ
jgi:type VI secretion system secreted protein Hcp